MRQTYFDPALLLGQTLENGQTQEKRFAKRREGKGRCVQAGTPTKWISCSSFGSLLGRSWGWLSEPIGRTQAHPGKLFLAQISNQQKPAIVRTAQNDICQPSSFSKTKRFAWVSGGFIERKIPGKTGEGTPRVVCPHTHTLPPTPPLGFPFDCPKVDSNPGIPIPLAEIHHWG